MKVLVMYKPDIYFEWLGADISKQFATEKKEFGNGYRFIRKYYPGIYLEK